MEQVRRQRRTCEEDIELIRFVTKNIFNCSDIGCVAEKPDIPRVISASKVEVDKISAETVVVTIVLYYTLYRNLLLQAFWDLLGWIWKRGARMPNSYQFLQFSLKQQCLGFPRLKC